MPPLNRQKGGGPETLQKDVEWTAKDADEQVATGIVMVPDKVDLQGDFVREDQLRAFADQFENFESVGEAGGGVMHAVWPDNHISLERNEVLDEAQEIGGETAPAGAWVQSYKFEDDQLWGLVEDGILSGYSVGIDSVRWDGPHEQADLEDVDVPEEIDEDQLVWEIVDGIMREVSAVDIPAVPDAQILDKAATEKRLAEHLGNRDSFLEEAQQRGHSESEAERLWEYLNEAVDIEGAGEPGEKTWFDRAKEYFLTGPGSPNDSEKADEATKEGRTLSKANKESAMAAVDANLDLLQDAGVDHSMTRFTDQDDVDFDLSEHDAAEWSATEGGDDEDEKNAAGGETPDSDDDTTMSDNEPDSEEKSLAEKNAEQIDGLTDKFDELTRAITGEEKTTEVELDGETVEVPESELKSALGVEEETPDDDIESLKSDVQTLNERLDSIAEQGGGSGQIRAGAGGDGGEDDDELSQISKALS